MKRKLAFIFAAPLLFCVLGFQGSCHSQCEELRQEVIKDCRNDLGPNSERCREDQKKFQETCHDESLVERPTRYREVVLTVSKYDALTFRVNSFICSLLYFQTVL